MVKKAHYCGSPYSELVVPRKHRCTLIANQFVSQEHVINNFILSVDDTLLDR